MPEQYTHTFKFELPNGFIKGDAEFNTDKKWSCKITSSSQPLQGLTLDYFNDLMDLIQKIYENNGGVDKILINKKE